MKQLLGALVGGAVAFVAYTGYKAASPHLGAWINVPQTASEQAAQFGDSDLDVSDEQYDRQAQRNSEIKEHFAAPSNPDPISNDLFQNIADKAKELEGGITEEEAGQLDSGQSEVIIPESEAVEPEVVVPEPEPAPEEIWEQEMEQVEKVPYEGAEELPDSGIALWFVMIFALCTAIGLKYRSTIKSVLCRKAVVA